MKRMLFSFFCLLPLALSAAEPPSKDILLGKFNPAEKADFVRIDVQYTDKSCIYMQREAYGAYLKMRGDALKEGIELTIVSATRNYDSQLAIWNRKWDRQSGSDSLKVRRIMRYSSMPGTSRHHWGTDVDFISVETGYWTHGQGLKAYRWLQANASKYGFFQPYTDDPERTGYAEERWHWSYCPISDVYTGMYSILIKPSDISGFNGAYLVEKLDIIKTHVLGIAECVRVDGE